MSTPCRTATPAPTWRSRVESVVKEIADRDGKDMTVDGRRHQLRLADGGEGQLGVILAQILRGLADSVQDRDGMDGAVLRDGLIRRRRRRLPGRPEPGRGHHPDRGPGRGRRRPGRAGGSGLVEVLEAARDGAGDALARTPDMLSVLKAAGVVDSGGTGLVLLLDAFLHVADGRPLPDTPETPASVVDLAGGAGEHHEGDDNGLRYEVMYLLEAPDESIGSFREVWAGLGDSIVVVGGDGLWNCHIHTDDIGAAIEAALEAGRPRQIRVTDLWSRSKRSGGSGMRPPGPRRRPRAEEPVRCAVVAVCTGEGIRRIFRSLGVHQVVSGGQSMNPSTAQICSRPSTPLPASRSSSSPTTRTSSPSPSRPPARRPSRSGWSPPRASRRASPP